MIYNLLRNRSTSTYKRLTVWRLTRSDQREQYKKIYFLLYDCYTMIEQKIDMSHWPTVIGNDF